MLPATTPLHAVATLAVTGKVAPTALLRDPLSTYDRILALASAAMALDPTLGRVLRFVQRGPVDPDERRQVSFQIQFSKDERSRLPFDVPEDPEPVLFWDALARTLPAAQYEEERERFAAQPREGWPTAEDAAIRGAFLATRVAFQRRRVNDELLAVTSFPVRPEPYGFLTHPDLARHVITAPISVSPEVRLDAIGRMRQSVQTLRRLLSRPYAECGATDRVAVAKTIESLNGRRTGGGLSFEEQQSHGWIAYALSQGAGDWTPYLLTRARCSPHALYGQISPMALAVATNNAPATQALLEAGVPANAVFHGWPSVYDPMSQNSLSRLEMPFVPPLFLATAVGATHAAGTLLQHGANPDPETPHGMTPLFVAAMANDEATARVLLVHGANAAHTNVGGNVPSEVVPNVPSGQALFDVLENARLRVLPPSPDAKPSRPVIQPAEDPVSPQTEDQDSHPIATPWLSERPSRRRPR